MLRISTQFNTIWKSLSIIRGAAITEVLGRIWQKWNLCFVYRLHSASLSFCLFVFFSTSKWDGSRLNFQTTACRLDFGVNQSDFFIRSPGKRESGWKLLEPIGTAHKSSACRTFIPLYLVIAVCFSSIYLRFCRIIRPMALLSFERPMRARTSTCRYFGHWVVFFWIGVKLVQAEV